MLFRSETVSPWRYADELPAAPPAPVKASLPANAAEPRDVLATTSSLVTVDFAADEVRVERGDSLWKLALRHLGDGNAWAAIAAANPQLPDPNHIRAGELLRLPSTATTARKASLSKPVIASTNGRKTVTVRKGDSLWKLAQSALGNGAAWSCIAEANPQITNADHIVAGQSLVLPANCNPQS